MNIYLKCALQAKLFFQVWKYLGVKPQGCLEFFFLVANRKSHMVKALKHSKNLEHHFLTLLVS